MNTMFGITYIIYQKQIKVNAGDFMKSEINILIAFILNLMFSVFEFIGGSITGSVAIVSDAVHDLGDAASIGISFYLERKSKKKPDESHSFGYARYSVIGGLITTIILLCGSVAIITNAVEKLFDPNKISYDGMIVFAVIGTAVNLIAAFVTRGGDTVNQKAVNLHMLEDVLGWVVVLIGAFIIKFTHLTAIDPLMSIVISLFILINAVRNLKDISDILLDKTPDCVSVGETVECIMSIDGIADVHHIHIRSIDGISTVATMHIVTNENPCKIKEKVRESLKAKGISHVTIETEKEDEPCSEKDCGIAVHPAEKCSHHHH